MKALTIHQPFAWAIGHDELGAPRKNYEIRPDPTKYRGPVLIHAGKRPPLNAPPVDAWRLEDIRPLPWVPYAPGFLGFWKVEAWRLGSCRAVYEAAWSELEGRSPACAS